MTFEVSEFTRRGRLHLGVMVLVIGLGSCDNFSRNDRTPAGAQPASGDERRQDGNAQPTPQPDTGNQGAALVPCPVADGFLCRDLPGFGSSPTNYCTLNRLAAITEIPKECPAGSCLMVATVDNVITVATCWDETAMRPVGASH